QQLHGPVEAGNPQSPCLLERFEIAQQLARDLPTYRERRPVLHRREEQREWPGISAIGQKPSVPGLAVEPQLGATARQPFDERTLAKASVPLDGWLGGNSNRAAVPLVHRQPACIAVALTIHRPGARRSEFRPRSPHAPPPGPSPSVCNAGVGRLICPSGCFEAAGTAPPGSAPPERNVGDARHVSRSPSPRPRPPSAPWLAPSVGALHDSASPAGPARWPGSAPGAPKPPANRRRADGGDHGIRGGSGGRDEGTRRRLGGE